MAKITTNHADRELHRLNSRLYTELARFTTGLFVGALALMTFLLSVGLQHPKTTIEVSIYVTFVTLGLALLSYVLSSVAEAQYLTLASSLEGLKKEDLEKATKAADKAQKNLRLMRQIQVVLFVVGVIAVAAFAIYSIALFFPAAVKASATGAQ